MLPVTITGADVLPVVYPIRVGYEIVVVVDGDVVVAAPAAIPTATSSPSRSHCHADAERDCHPGSVIPRRGIRDRWIRIDRRTVHDGWIVARYVDYVRTRGLD